MKKNNRVPEKISTISALHASLGIKGPKHPLISIINLEEIVTDSPTVEESLSFSYNFYIIGLKKNYEAKVRYGQNYYDFDSGILSCIGPGQIISVDSSAPQQLEGYLLVVHSDFFAQYPLAKRIKEYGFFSYATNEALHMSDAEELTIISMLKNMQNESSTPIDHFTQDLLVSNLELLLNYCNRFYNRQFITRKHVTSDIISSFETLLNSYIDNGESIVNGLPTVHYFAEKLSTTPNYLSDLLRASTGRSASHHIQDKAIEKAKELLGSTELTVAEIAYQLGFEFPQSLNKLFKKKTSITPLDYRQSLN